MLATTALPEHLRLGVTLPGMREGLLQLPSDAVEQVNTKMEEVSAKMVAKGKPPFPKNVAVNGYIWATSTSSSSPSGKSRTS